ncbi:fumarylacetoacetase [Xylona heveae TC161]|uniref:Fumarylacetoacetase n=1 Tax=Xylona heveae (strain CBS 132557 / TC161) TaxID=1328760 RepID=A0A165GIY3_XYLHT|nr:fumarylacetoacetase [Xylona heveae TC161]KZF22241.1 fumarylacetoacetase [Xylona heveae TC161]
MARKSWLPIPHNSHFSLSNLPFGIITTPTSRIPHVAVAIGNYALDLHMFSSSNGHAAGGFNDLAAIKPYLSVFSQPTLNAFAALGRPLHRQVREYLQDVFSEDTPYPDILKLNKGLQAQSLYPLDSIETHMPFHIGDYTDFYAGKNHAYTVGVLFREPNTALQPNYTHLPVAYHGRASSVVVSGTPIRRPWGQIIKDSGSDSDSTPVPVHQPCKRLDFELELGAFICRANDMGEPIPVVQAHDYIFGYVLLNDWSARDVQTWEYVPLGPFTAKNFGTSISAWVILADALEPFKAKGLENEHQVLDYLREADPEKSALDLNLEVDLTTKKGNTYTICRSNGRNLLWSYPQMIAHHTVTGCPMAVGDLLGSGTISGTREGTQGCLLEQTQGGRVPITLGHGSEKEERMYLQDGDTVRLRAWAGGRSGVEKEGELVGFGDCVGTVMPALQR